VAQHAEVDGALAQQLPLLGGGRLDELDFQPGAAQTAGDCGEDGGGGVGREREPQLVRGGPARPAHRRDGGVESGHGPAGGLLEAAAVLGEGSRRARCARTA
jgi:hypothetical protein